MSAPPRETTLRAAHVALRARLRAGGVDSPDLDARILLAEATGTQPDALLLGADRPLSSGEAEAIDAFARRRLAGEPVGRILGRREFWGLPFALSADTLEPRPDTETVVEAALSLVPDPTAAIRFADIGTGTGALAVALLSELPGALALATDIAPGALRAAQANSMAAKVADRIVFAVADFAAPLAPGFDFVVSNPPYIRTADLAGLSPEVRDHDPLRALDGGPDGLAPYRVIAAEAFRAIRRNGHLIVEIGWDQGEEVSTILSDAGFDDIVRRRDLGGRDRVVIGRRSATGRGRSDPT